MKAINYYPILILSLLTINVIALTAISSGFSGLIDLQLSSEGGRVIVDRRPIPIQNPRGRE